jgi:hypothetical protein
MKVVETVKVLAAGPFSKSAEWKRALSDASQAIRATDWPHGSGEFTIRPIRHGNGVKPIKTPCIRALHRLGWKIETFPKLKQGVLTSGDLDALLETLNGYVGFEWETGNISSSHRALNKLLLTIFQEGIKAGILVVPSSRLYGYLTDRVGNIKELRPYIPLWQALPIREGCLQILVVEHDREDPRVRRIPKGTDGRANR